MYFIQDDVKAEAILLIMFATHASSCWQGLLRVESMSALHVNTQADVCQVMYADTSAPESKIH